MIKKGIQFWAIVFNKITQITLNSFFIYLE